MTDYWAEHACLPTGPADNVLLTEQDGRWTKIITGAEPGSAHRLPGVLFPGFANCHSHAFHRALRGRTHQPFDKLRTPLGQGSAGGVENFWTWRTAMYEVAARLDPDSYLRLARATYAEMALSGITAVGEFHYLHHNPDGSPYTDPNAMAAALRQAAAEAGIRLTLLDTCYLAGGLTGQGHQALSGPQLRFGDGDADAWAARTSKLTPDDNTRIGAAIHSVRAVPRDQLHTVASAAADRPLHVHLSEQPAENQACKDFYGMTPTALLAEADALGRRTTAVHATHLEAADVAELGRTRTTACFCPSTEADLADGIGPARALADAGAPLSLGTDQHAMIDFFAEARALELHERLATGHRGRFIPAELIKAATAHDSIGWPDAGRLEVGSRADLVAVRTDSIRTAGAEPGQLIMAATASDVHTVITGGMVVVDDHRHRLGDVGRLLADAIEPLWRQP
ncbi:formimidoylglutamate deiminase [Microlunatus elymi]|uniref:Formimidoylglutamate deiminase n=1 Tax=Microlunatus elymi TaxID=2596828 RepID=A0A516Q2W2_9ACTN|nr:formimidoylglutamate deiminase [Microlunatus elymi]QDP97770.1 formimidoylglutamate deiminase [Microlunatus elymi]